MSDWETQLALEQHARTQTVDIHGNEVKLSVEPSRLDRYGEPEGFLAFVQVGSDWFSSNELRRLAQAMDDTGYGDQS